MKFYEIFGAITLVFALSLSLAQCWDSREMQMFDLVEELNGTFYEFLDVKKDATSAEIRRAYRRKSLIYHPDKNAGDPAAEKIFRQLVGVYEVLKDEKFRERYNDVLVNGLPTWRQPVFYYRQLRKMGLLETCLLVFSILTIGHYFVLWGSYLERKLNMEDYLSNVYKKGNKARKKQKEVDNVIQEELSSLPRPRIREVWPIALTVGTYRFIRDFPSLCKYIVSEVRSEIEKWRQEKQRKKEEEEEMKQMIEEEKKLKELKKKRKAEKAERIRSQMESNAALVKEQPVVYSKGVTFNLVNPDEGMEMKTGEWTNSDWINLTHAMNKFRPGVPERWQRIAEKVGRPVEEITAKAKEMKNRGDMPMGASVQNSVSGLDTDVLSGRVDGGITMRESAFVVVENAVCGTSSEEEDEYESAKQRRQARRRKKKQTDRRPEPEEEEQTMENTATVETIKADNPEEKTNLNSFPKSVFSWSQNEQTALETALKKYPKGTHERWDRISDSVGTRSKTDCMDRVRYLTEKVKSKSK